MIYTSYDYISKYSDTIAEIIALARLDKYSFEYIENTLANSKMINEFEYSNITSIAFTSSSLIYRELFPSGKAVVNDIPLFDENYWIGEMYVHIFLKYKITFEAIFALIPLNMMSKQYSLYHEMDVTQFDEYFESLLKEGLLSRFMQIRKMSSINLSKKTGISVSTIRAIKEGKRDINKMQSMQLEKIAVALNIKTRSLINPISLELANII